MPIPKQGWFFCAVCCHHFFKAVQPDREVDRRYLCSATYGSKLGSYAAMHVLGHWALTHRCISGLGFRGLSFGCSVDSTSGAWLSIRWVLRHCRSQSQLHIHYRPLIIRIGFWAHYTTTTIRTPPQKKKKYW